MILPPGLVVYESGSRMAAARSTVPFVELAKRFGDGAGDSQCDRSLSNRVPSEAIADGVHSAIGGPARHTSLAAGAARLIRKPQWKLELQLRALPRFDTEIAKSEMVFSHGCWASTVRTSSSAISARIAVVEIGASSVMERLNERRSAKRPRTVTVRPGRELARSRLQILSARWRSVGRKTHSSAGLLPSADLAPADPARRWLPICRGTQF